MDDHFWCGHTAQKIVVDLSEHLAGKTAIQEAAAKLTERLLPKLVK